MKIYIERENKNIEIPIEKSISLKGVLNQLNISLESVILLKNGDIVLEEELVCDRDKVDILSVVSGG